MYNNDRIENIIHIFFYYLCRLGKSMVQLVEQGTLTEPGILLIARFLWFLPVLCTTLKQCLVSLYQQVRHIKTILFNY